MAVIVCRRSPQLVALANRSSYFAWRDVFALLTARWTDETERTRALLIIKTQQLDSGFLRYGRGRARRAYRRYPYYGRD
jgi:hypothetical protein